MDGDGDGDGYGHVGSDGYCDEDGQSHVHKNADFCLQFLVFVKVCGIIWVSVLLSAHLNRLCGLPYDGFII